MQCGLPTTSLKAKFFIFSIIIVAVYLFLFYVFIEIWFIRSIRKNAVTNAVVLPHVIVHIDLKGAPPKLGYLQSLLPMLKDHGVTGLLMEYEDMFPYEGKLVNLSAKTCYNKIQLRNFLLTAVHSGFDIIPLVQTFGHLEHVLKLREFRHLREAPVYPDSICPSKVESRAMVNHMLEQVINFHNSIKPLKRIHVGCDEVFHINTCAQCIDKGLSNADLFIDYIRHISKIVSDLSPDTTMLIWDDMFRGIKPIEWNKIDCFNNVEPVYWDYQPSVSVSHVNLHTYHKKFKNIWAASAFKGADGKTAVIPNLKERASNHFSWMNLMLDYKIAGNHNNFHFQGIILTGWSRYSHMDPPCELLPVSIPSLVLNLLIVRYFTLSVPIDDGVTFNLDNFFSKHVKDEVKAALKCKTGLVVNALDILDCNYEGNELYKILKQCNYIKDDMAFGFHNDLTGLWSIEYYSKLKHINMNTLLEHHNWCNNTLNELQNVEKQLFNAMKRYYFNDFIQEYIGFRTYDSKKKLKDLLNMLYSYMYTRVWERRPVSNITRT